MKHGGKKKMMYGGMNRQKKLYGQKRLEKRIKLIQPTLHKYLYSYTNSAFRRIDADEFVIATMLPVQQFKKE